MMNARDFLATDSLLAERVRLAIVATLAASEAPVEFTTLLDVLDLSKGNLSSHMRKLEDAGLVEVRKEFVGRKPRTTYACTAAGRQGLQDYLAKLEALLKGTPVGATPGDPEKNGDPNG
jgi:DNA-binding transcriptional ArsR family regulator